MKKVLSAVFIAVLLAVPMMPAQGWCWRGDRHHGHHGHRHHHYHSHGDEAVLFGLGGLVLGATAIALMQEPRPRRVVYVDPAPAAYAYGPPVTYAYAPPVVERTCRWERFILDGWGRYMYDRHGRPVKEYATGPCDAPPPW